MAPDALKRAKEAAKTDGMTVGRWLEDAVQEKLERREPNSGNVG